MGWIHDLTVGDWLAVAGLPLLVLGYLEAFTKYGPKMAGLRRPLGFLFLAIAGIAYAADLADRFGAFGPTKKELQKSVISMSFDNMASDKKRARLQGAVDYWHQKAKEAEHQKSKKVRPQSGPSAARPPIALPGSPTGASAPPPPHPRAQ